jgi:hypothetical protein
LEYIVAIWCISWLCICYIFPRFGLLYQDKSCNPGFDLCWQKQLPILHAYHSERKIRYNKIRIGVKPFEFCNLTFVSVFHTLSSKPGLPDFSW